MTDKYNQTTNGWLAHGRSCECTSTQRQIDGKRLLIEENGFRECQTFVRLIELFLRSVSEFEGQKIGIHGPLNLITGPVHDVKEKIKNEREERKKKNESLLIFFARRKGNRLSEELFLASIFEKEQIVFTVHVDNDDGDDDGTADHWL